MPLSYVTLFNYKKGRVSYVSLIYVSVFCPYGHPCFHLSFLTFILQEVWKYVKILLCIALAYLYVGFMQYAAS